MIAQLWSPHWPQACRFQLLVCVTFTFYGNNTLDKALWVYHLILIVLNCSNEIKWIRSHNCAGVSVVETTYNILLFFCYNTADGDTHHSCSNSRIDSNIRRAERRWRQTHLLVHRDITILVYTSLVDVYRERLVAAKYSCFCEKIR